MSLIPGPVRRGFESSLNPVVDRLISLGVNPNTITTVGTLILAGSGVAYGLGGVRLGGVLLLLSGVCDMLDGRVARGTGGATKFGAFYDSTLDRVGEAALFSGIAVFFMRGGVPPAWELAAVLLSFLALAAAVLVSYARARAEGLGLECKVGFAQRAERILGLGVPSLFFGAGPNGFLLLAIVAVLGAVASVTVVQRIVHVYRLTRVVRRRRTTEARRVTPALAEFFEKGSSGDE